MAIVPDTSVITKNPYIAQVLAELAPLNPAKIILFGSYASGTATADSDLDLLVVTNSPELPQTYQDKEQIFLEVARRLRDIRRKISIDLIVHTMPMYERFKEMNSAFARDIEQKGILLYESDHA